MSQAGVGGWPGNPHTPRPRGGPVCTVVGLYRSWVTGPPGFGRGRCGWYQGGVRRIAVLHLIVEVVVVEKRSDEVKLKSGK